MALKITEGDIVDVQYTDNNLSNATVLQMPRGEGDLLQVEHNGVVYAINTQHPEFVGLLKWSKETNDDDS